MCTAWEAAVEGGHVGIQQCPRTRVCVCMHKLLCTTLCMLPRVLEVSLCSRTHKVLQLSASCCWMLLHTHNRVLCSADLAAAGMPSSASRLAPWVGQIQGLQCFAQQLSHKSPAVDCLSVCARGRTARQLSLLSLVCCVRVTLLSCSRPAQWCARGHQQPAAQGAAVACPPPPERGPSAGQH